MLSYRQVNIWYINNNNDREQIMLGTIIQQSSHDMGKVKLGRGREAFG
jgi:hypothetical protein